MGYKFYSQKSLIWHWFEACMEIEPVIIWHCFGIFLKQDFASFCSLKVYRTVTGHEIPFFFRMDFWRRTHVELYQRNESGIQFWKPVFNSRHFLCLISGGLPPLPCPEAVSPESLFNIIFKNLPAKFALLRTFVKSWTEYSVNQLKDLFSVTVLKKFEYKQETKIYLK